MIRSTFCVLTLTLNFLIAPTAHAGDAAAIARTLADLDLRLTGAVSPPPGVVGCARQLRTFSRALAAQTAELPRPSKASDDLVTKSFAVRTHLRDRLRAWVTGGVVKGPVGATCVTEVRKTMSALRLVEDRLTLAGGFARSPAPATLTGSSAYLTVAGDRPVRLRSGDVLLSRGNAFVSAAIAKIAVTEGDFSHLAQVYIDAPSGTEVDARDAADDPRVFTVEAHIEVGSFTRPYREYVADGNARVAQFRPRQSVERAHRAAQVVFDWVRSWRHAHAEAYRRSEPTVNDNIPYDFKMVLSNADEVFCAEIVSIAQRAVGWSVPLFSSVLRQNQVTETMGITARQTFAPSDLEIDPRFDQLAEWRNLPKLDAVLKKDIVFREIYRLMERGKFKFNPTPADHAKAYLAWTARQADLAFLDKLPKNMSPSVIALTFAIDRAGEDLVSRLVTKP